MIYQKFHLKELFPFLGNNGCNPVLEAYIPTNLLDKANLEKKHAGILICPGGGYQFVSKREAEPIALKFLQDGYRVFVLTYSVRPHTFPTQIREVAGAVELIHKYADNWMMDANRLAIMGFSAGGHLACHYSNCYNCKEVRDVFPNSKPVQAAVLAYPVITGDPQFRHKGSFVNLTGHAEPTEEDIEKFSLQNRVSEHTPPTFIWHTKTDDRVPVINALLYAQALAIHDVSFGLHIYPEGQHGLATVDEVTCVGDVSSLSDVAQWVNEARVWLKKTL